jgi:uncharacterized protein involved in response to NO
MGVVRREPYRLFFPLAAVLGGIGVGHWLLYTLGLLPSYSAQGHALVQVQGFLMAFATGFLLTMVPRRTQTRPASLAVIALLAGLLVVTAVASLMGAWLVAEGSFLALLLTLVSFAVWRFLVAAARRRPPDAFVLLPFGLLSAALGALLLILEALGVLALGHAAMARGMVQEGLFLCLTMGIGHLVLPLLSGHETPADGDASPRSVRERLFHAAVGALIVLSFPLERSLRAAWEPEAAVRLAYGLRFALVMAELVHVKAWRRPVVPGLHRRYAWTSFWMVPLGLLLVAILPEHRAGLLHVTFIGGFGLMSFTVGSHVIAAHGGFPEVVAGKPWQVRTFALLFLFAMTTRVTADFLGRGYWPHVGAAAGIWLLALAVWTAFLVPKVIVAKRT